MPHAAVISGSETPASLQLDLSAQAPTFGVDYYHLHFRDTRWAPVSAVMNDHLGVSGAEGDWELIDAVSPVMTEGARRWIRDLAGQFQLAGIVASFRLLDGTDRWVVERLTCAMLGFVEEADRQAGGSKGRRRHDLFETAAARSNAQGRGLAIPRWAGSEVLPRVYQPGGVREGQWACPRLRQ